MGSSAVVGVEVQDVELEPHGLQVFVNAPTWTLPQTVQATLPTMLRATCSLRFSLCQVTDFHLGVGFFFSWSVLSAGSRLHSTCGGTWKVGGRSSGWYIWHVKMGSLVALSGTHRKGWRVFWLERIWCVYMAGLAVFFLGFSVVGYS